MTALPGLVVSTGRHFMEQVSVNWLSDCVLFFISYFLFGGTKRSSFISRCVLSLLSSVILSAAKSLSVRVGLRSPTPCMREAFVFHHTEEVIVQKRATRVFALLVILLVLAALA